MYPLPQKIFFLLNYAYYCIGKGSEEYPNPITSDKIPFHQHHIFQPIRPEFNIALS